MPWRKSVRVIEADAVVHQQVAGVQQVTEDSKGDGNGALQHQMSQVAWAHSAGVSG